MLLTGENWNTSRETCPIAILSTTNPTWTCFVSNMGFCSKRSSSNHVSYCTARWVQGYVVVACATGWPSCNLWCQCMEPLCSGHFAPYLCIQVRGGWVYVYTKVYPDFWKSPLTLTVAGSVTFSATCCHSIAVLWVSLVNFAAINLSIASQAVFIIVLVKCSPWFSSGCSLRFSSKLGYFNGNTGDKTGFTLVTQKPNSSPFNQRSHSYHVSWRPS